MFANLSLCKSPLIIVTNIKISFRRAVYQHPREMIWSKVSNGKRHP